MTQLLAYGKDYDCGLAGKLHLAGAHGRIEPRGDDGYRVFHWSHDPEDQWPAGHAYAEWIGSQGRDLGEFRNDPGSIPRLCTRLPGAPNGRWSSSPQSAMGPG